MATNNDINYVSFTFEHEEQSDISPFDVEVEITVLEQYKIAEYKFNNTLYNLIPEFNDGFTYTYEDVVEGDVTTRTIYSDSLPTLMRFGSETGIEANEKTQSLLEVNYIDTSNFNTMRFMFRSCENLIAVNSSNWNTSNVTNFQDMFYGCKKLSSIDVSSWDTTNVVIIASMFCDCWSLQTIIGLNKWNVYKTTSVSATFARCYALENIDISNWHLNESVELSYLFHDSTNLKHVEMKNSDYNSLNKIIEALPDRSVSNIDLSQIDVMQANEKNWRIAGDTKGTLDMTGVDDITQVNITTAEAKNWNIISDTNTSIMIGNSPIQKLYIGSEKISKIYIGERLIYITGQSSNE